MTSLKSISSAIFQTIGSLWPCREDAAALGPDVEEWDRAARISLACGAHAVFLKNLEEWGHAGKVSDSILKLLNARSKETRLQTHALLELSKKILEAMRREGIQAAPLKGASFAPEYPDPGLRPMSDVDLLIRGSDFDACRRLFKSLGLGLADPVRNGVLVNPGQECLFRSPENHQVDVHYRFFPWYEEKFIYRFDSQAVLREAGIERLSREMEIYYALLVLHRSDGNSYWHWTDLRMLLERASPAEMKGLEALINSSALKNNLLKILAKGRNGDAACESALALIKEDEASRFKYQRFVWLGIRNPFEGVELLAAWLFWKLFKATGLFKGFFLKRNNPGGLEVIADRSSPRKNGVSWRLNTRRFAVYYPQGKPLLVNLRNGDHLALEGSSAFIWNCLMAGDVSETVARKLAETFGISLKTARRDVKEFLGDLKKEGSIAHSAEIE